jgi:hypothetical protein
MPAISAFPDGSIGAVFYDRRSGPAALQVYAVHATFRGGFRSTRNVKVNGGSPQVSDIYYLAPGSTCFAPGRFFGDYIGGQPCGSAELCSVWADTQRRIHNQTDVWFARVPLPALTSARRTQ